MFLLFCLLSCGDPDSYCRGDSESKQKSIVDETLCLNNTSLLKSKDSCAHHFHQLFQLLRLGVSILRSTSVLQTGSPLCFFASFVSSDGTPCTTCLPIAFRQVDSNKQNIEGNTHATICAAAGTITPSGKSSTAFQHCLAKLEGALFLICGSNLHFDVFILFGPRRNSTSDSQRSSYHLF